jgi:hypothetical protein
VVEGDDLPGRGGRGEGPFQPRQLVGVAGVVGVEGDEGDVAEHLGVPPPRHAQRRDLGIGVAVLDVVIAEDGQQPGAGVEHGAEGLEDRRRQPGRVARRVHVVAEQDQGVVGAVGAGGHDRRPRLGRPVVGVADVSGHGDPVEGAGAGGERLQWFGVRGAAPDVGGEGDDLSAVQPEPGGRAHGQDHPEGDGHMSAPTEWSP